MWMLNQDLLILMLKLGGGLFGEWVWTFVIASGQRPFEIIWPSRRPSTICPFSSQLNDCQQTDLFSLGKTSKDCVQCKFATANNFFFSKCALGRFVRGVWFDRNINISPTCLSTTRGQQPQILQRSLVQSSEKQNGNLKWNFPLKGLSLKKLGMFFVSFTFLWSEMALGEFSLFLGVK